MTWRKSSADGRAIHDRRYLPALSGTALSLPRYSCGEFAGDVEQIVFGRYGNCLNRLGVVDDLVFVPGGDAIPGQGNCRF